MTVTSSGPQVGRAVAHRLRRKGFRHATVLEALGVEVAAGRRLSYRRLRKRILATRRRFPRLRMLRKAGAIVGRFARQALPPAMQY
eukprot:605489-Pyramimonas_sp.AAC.1